MTVSVIIPTYNGAHRILNLIKALELQTFKDFETVVVIDGSTDNTQEVLHQHQSTLKQLKIIHQANGGRARVRNRGAKEANGDLLIFFDDDMRPQPDSVRKHLDFHLQYHKSICGGNQLEDFSVLNTDIQRYKAHISRKWTEKYNMGRSKLNDKNLFLTAANMSVPKKLFDQLGGFNESLKDAEDYEFAVRAFENGIGIYFDKSNVAWHDDFISCRSYIMRQRQYNHANGELKKHIPPKYHRTEIQAKLIPWFKRIVYRLCGQPVMIKMIDNEQLKWLPRFLKYRIYDWVITYYGKVNTRINL